MDIGNALVEWRELLGAENVLTDRDALTEVQTATFATTQQVPAILRPGNRDEVRGALLVANRHRVPLHPVSRGRNWGLGSRVPVRDTTVVMDLRRMARIVDFSERLAYMTIEPGVTFQQAFEFLQQQGSNLVLSITGGPPDGSLIGNTLERGDGLGPYGERLGHACGLEVVLPTGECVHTGYGRFRHSRASAVSRFGVGPYLDGLFTQSNLGVVTQMTVWLMPRPSSLRVIRCVIFRQAKLPALLDAVRRLQLEGVLATNNFGLWNSYKCAATCSQYPWPLVGEQTPLKLDEVFGAEPWWGTAIVSGATNQIAEACARHVHETLAPFADHCFVEYGYQPTWFETPSQQNVRSVYWRKRHAVPANLDPERDGCGVIWLCHALPMDGSLVLESVNLVDCLVKTHGFEPNVGLSCVDGRSLHQYLAILYDRQLDGEDKCAMDCQDDVLRQLATLGVLPYRLGIQSMDSLPPAQDDYGTLIAALKRGLDPRDVLSPGRYDFRAEWPST